jgi:hypothetical protein
MKSVKKFGQRQRILPAVVQQRLPDLLLLGLIQVSPEDRFPSQPSVLSIRYRHASVGHIAVPTSAVSSRKQFRL